VQELEPVGMAEALQAFRQMTVGNLACKLELRLGLTV
jgi:hypothetical protein